MELFKVKARTLPELDQIKGQKKLKHLCRSFPHRQFYHHNRFIEGKTISTSISPPLRHTFSLFIRLNYNKWSRVQH